MILRVRFVALLGEHEHACKCGQRAVWNCETVFTRESPYVTQPDTVSRRWRKVCQTCRERIEGGSR